MITGNITNVVETPVGTVVTEDLPAGVDALPIADPEFFSPEGGRLRIGEEEFAYTIGPDDTLMLDGFTTEDYEESEPVYPLPYAVERWAFVREEGGEEELQVRVPYAMWDRIPLGARGEDPEYVEAILVDGVAVLFDVIGRAPVINGEHLDPETVPVPDIEFTDGEPPDESPTPTVRAGIGSLIVTWDAITNHDPVTYEVHASTSSGFTPGPSTLIGSIRGTTLSFTALSDGTPLDYGTDYFVRIIARDEDGAAAPSMQATNRPRQAGEGDIEANSIVTAHLVTDDLIANSVIIGLLQGEFGEFNKLAIPGETGQRLEQDIDGLRLYNSDDEVTANLSTQSGSAYLRGRVDFGTGSSLLPGDTLEIKDQPTTDYETPELVQAQRRVGSGTSGIVLLDSDGQAGAVRILFVRSFSNVTHTLVTAFDEEASYWELVASVATSDAGRLSVWVRTEEDDPAPPFTPTINFGSSTDWIAGCIEYVGLELGEAHDVVETTSGGPSSSITIGPTTTTTQDGTLALAFVAWRGQDHILGSGWQQVGPGGFSTLVASRVSSTQEALSYSGAFEDDASSYLGILAAFKLRPAGGTPPQPSSGHIRFYSDGEKPHYIDSNGDPYELATTDLIPGKMVAGTVEVNTNGKGNESAAVAHGLGATPSQVLCTARDGTAVLRVSSRNSTHFTVDVFHREQTGTFSTNVPVDWLAIA